MAVLPPRPLPLAAFEAIAQIARKTTVKGTVPAGNAGMNTQHPFPLRVQEVLGELVGVVQEGLQARSVGVGLGVLAEPMEEEVTEVVGPKGRHDPDRSSVRHGHRPGEVTLGGRRVGVERPRVRSTDRSGEVALAVYQHFADRDPLSRIVLERMLAGVSCRRYGRVQEPVGVEVEARAVSATRSATSWVTCPSATGRWYAAGCGQPGLNNTTTGLWSVWSCLQVSSPIRTRVLPTRCARGWPRP